MTAWKPASLACLVLFLCACAGTLVDEVGLSLSGAQEVPPVTTAATGKGSIRVGPDRTVSGSITTSGIAATQAHIHVGASGANGPVIVPLARSGDNGWTVPAGARLTDAQYESFREGNLYVNVHSKTHPGGEIRAQLVPRIAAPNPAAGY